MIKADDIVGCYVSMKDEADTYPIIRYCFDHGIPVAVPKVVDNTLQFHRICSFDQLKEGTFGVSEPIVSCPVAVYDITLMFVPLSSYDDACHRTGYGKGYYDSVLNECGRKIGLAYSEQKMESIETDPWDVILDEIIAA